MSNEFKIEAGKYYRLRSGERAYVALTNRPGEKPILGWLDDGQLLDWHDDGSRHGMDPSRFDIVGEWVEPERIPWEHLPKWCRWWAKDSTGTEWGYRNKPESAYAFFITKDDEDDFICPVLPENYSNYTGDWRNSLRERPEGV